MSAKATGGNGRASETASTFFYNRVIAELTELLAGDAQTLGTARAPGGTGGCGSTNTAKAFA
ncbi:MAG: hypothetical protein ABI671_20485, partial [Burkholderiales bacterium]